jgi:AAA+ ATPase superfamily predicted ATPase
MPDVDLFIDRDAELAELRALADRRRPAIALLYGRRRVGKTYLLEHAWADRRVFYFVAADATPEINRKELIAELSAWSGQNLDPAEYPTWRTVFRLLADLAGEEQLVAVLDEFQYLMGGDDDIASQLVAVFDRELRGRPLLLALSGSSVAMMESLLSGGQPLFGRSGWSAKIGPFDYRDAARMVTGRSNRDAALIYGIFGGTPRYLAAIAPAESLAEAVMRTMLSPRGEIYLQLEHIIEQEKGIRRAAEYNSILRAIAGGDHAVNNIANKAGLDVIAVRAALRTLEDLEYVWKERNFDAAPNAAYQYRLADNALAFWFRFVHANRSRLQTGAVTEVWQHHVEPYLNEYMGKVLERICRQAFQRYHTDWGLPGATVWARWEGQDRNRRPIEIDAVARLDDKRILTGEIKWSSKPVGAGIHTDLIRDLQDLAASGYAWAREALMPTQSAGHFFVSAAGFSHEMEQTIATTPTLHGWTLDDLYR